MEYYSRQLAFLLLPREISAGYFRAFFAEFVKYDFIKVEPKFVGRHDAVDEHTGDLLMNMFQIVIAWLVAPLKALQKLGRFNAD